MASTSWRSAGRARTDVHGTRLRWMLNICMASRRAANPKYWLGRPTDKCGGRFGDLQKAVNAAANDSSVHVVSMSWGTDVDSSDARIHERVAAARRRRLGPPSWSVQETMPRSVIRRRVRTSWPSAARNSIRATVATNPSRKCGRDRVMAVRTSRGTGLADRDRRCPATCPKRAVPDVATDADRSSGAHVVSGGHVKTMGGTSLTAPLWAGMLADWNARN